MVKIESWMTPDSDAECCRYNRHRSQDQERAVRTAGAVLEPADERRTEESAHAEGAVHQGYSGCRRCAAQQRRRETQEGRNIAPNPDLHEGKRRNTRQRVG